MDSLNTHVTAVDDPDQCQLYYYFAVADSGGSTEDVFNSKHFPHYSLDFPDTNDSCVKMTPGFIT